MVTSPLEVTEPVKSSFAPSSVTKVPFTIHTPFSSGPLGSSSIIIEATFPCRDLVPIMYFLITLFASSALSIRNLNQLLNIKGLLLLAMETKELRKPAYLTLPPDLPFLFAIFFCFFCHSGLVKLKTYAFKRSIFKQVLNRARLNVNRSREKDILVAEFLSIIPCHTYVAIRVWCHFRLDSHVIQS